MLGPFNKYHQQIKAATTQNMLKNQTAWPSLGKKMALINGMAYHSVPKVETPAVKSNTALIVGLTVGTIALLAIVLACSLKMRKAKKSISHSVVGVDDQKLAAN